jgi:outer membrane biosynthesis protein TonB
MSKDKDQLADALASLAAGHHADDDAAHAAHDGHAEHDAHAAQQDPSAADDHAAHATHAAGEAAPAAEPVPAPVVTPQRASRPTTPAPAPVARLRPATPKPMPQPAAAPRPTPAARPSAPSAAVVPQPAASEYPAEEPAARPADPFAAGLSGYGSSAMPPAAPAPAEVARPPRRTTGARGRKPRHQNLEFRRTLIPVTLTFGTICLGFGCWYFLLDADDPLKAPSVQWIALTVISLGVVSTVLAVMNMLHVKNELERATGEVHG